MSLPLYRNRAKAATVNRKFYYKEINPRSFIGRIIQSEGFFSHVR